MTTRNWATNITFQDAQTSHPQSIAQLQDLVSTGEKVRARGSAHCFNTIADTKNVAVILDQMPDLMEINTAGKSVRVCAGVKYAQLAEFLSEKGWALHNLASLPHISIAGAVSTGTHGSGIKNGALHTAVRSVELIGADGSLRKFTRGVDSEFYTSVVALGLTGISTSFELDIEPSFEIMQTVYGDLPRTTFQENLIEILSGAYSVSYLTTWGNNKAGDLWFKSKSQPPAEFFGALARTEKAHPIFGVDPTACTEQFGVAGPWHLRLPHFRIDANPSAGNELQSEFFVASENAPAAFAILEETSPSFRHKLLVTEVRAIAADEHWLSPAYQRETVAFHFTWENDPEVLALVALIESALQPFAIRPHFGKVFNLGGDHLASVLPRFGEFREHVLRLDPHGKFQNDFTSALLSF